jgi:uncharacterized phage protein (TIGR02220 family)
MEKNNFILYKDYEEHVDLLSNEEAGKLFKAIFRYVDGRNISELEGMTKMAFSFIKKSLERDLKKYKEKCNVNAINGAKGGRPKGSNNNPTVIEETERLNKKPKKADIGTDTDIDTDIDIGNDKDTITIVEKEETFSVKEVIEYLNFKVQGTYRHTTKKTISLINARKSEGFTFDEFKTAIDNSYMFWLSKGKGFDNMKPSTIFNGSFENRVNNSAYSYSKSMSNNGNSDIDDMQYLHDKYKAEEEENDKK